MPQDADPPDDAPWPLAGSGYGSPAAPAPPSLTSSLAEAIGYSLDTLATNRVNNLAFPIPAEAYDALTDGLSYRVYHTPRSKTLLSIEPRAFPKSGQAVETAATKSQSRPSATACQRNESAQADFVPL